MDRRQFLQAALLPFAAPGGSLIDELKPVTIKKITGFRLACPRPKPIGKDAARGEHGRFTSEDVLWVSTNLGPPFEGFGVGRSEPALARRLLGHSLAEYWRPGIGVVSPLGRSDHALYDLIGKCLNLPTWKVLGGMGPEWVRVFDGSLDFDDLLPESQNRGVARLLEEVEAGLKAGHRAFKIKVGRGRKGMEPEAGFRRDVEVVRAVRKLIGKGVRLMADADDAFDLETAERWLDAVGGELFWVEEPFPEQIDRDLMLKDHVRRKGWATLIADGVSAADLDDLDGLIRHEALDVLRPDIRAFGLTRQCALARKLALRPRISLSPHNRGSFLGFYMQLVLARGVPNVLMAEQDPSTCDLFDASAFEFKEGRVRVPSLPGCGLAFRKDVFEKRYRHDAWVAE